MHAPASADLPGSADAGGASLPPCASCGTARVGLFCHACGQSVRQEGRLTMAGFGSSLVHFVTHFDHGLPHTLATLFRSPGDLARRYVAGERQHFTHPLTLLLLSAILVVLTFPLYEAPFREIVAENLRASAAAQTPEARAAVEKLMGTPDQMAARTMAFVKANTKVLSFANALPLALILAGLLRRRYTIAEWLVATMYLVAGVNLVTAFTNPFLVRGLPALGFEPSPTGLSLVNVALYTGATAWMAARFYRPGVRTAALGGFAYLVTAAVQFLVSGIVAFVIGLASAIAAKG